MTPAAAMVFAAGLGTRMGALAADRPKPLVPVAGRALIDHALAHTGALPRVVVNTHHRAGQIAGHLRGRAVRISHEAELLDTGGGLKAALPHLGPGPVFTLNSDAVWSGPNPLEVLAAAWRPGMAALLLLVPGERTRGRLGGGDARMAPDGHLIWGGDMVYTGAQIVETAPLAAIPEPVFPMQRLWALGGGSLHAVAYPGLWCDAGHPAGVAAAEAMLAGAP